MAGVFDDERISISGGRVTVIAPNEQKPIARVQIIEGPEHGNATVNPDNSIALVLSGNDYAGRLALKYKITFEDGSTDKGWLNFDVARPVQGDGWGTGQHYMLAEDASGNIIVETGETHRKVYVSGSNTALTRADIAAREGVDAADITGTWLARNGVYGASEGTALETGLAMELWTELTAAFGTGIPKETSHWLMFERGHAYQGTGRLVNELARGEDPLRPMHITSWGTGDRPVLSDQARIFQGDSANIVFSSLTFTGGVQNLNGDNVIFNDVRLEDRMFNIQDVQGFTVHDSEIVNVITDKPSGGTWNTYTSGLFASGTEGMLLEGNIFHHNGWEDNYLSSGSTAGGMLPNKFSHNVYLQWDTRDVTFRDNIVSQGASFGVHFRGGAYIEGNVFVDNNFGFDTLGGAYDGKGHVGNFTLALDNVVTSAGYKETDSFIGAVSSGIVNRGLMSSFVGNIVTHLADPANPAELAEKPVTEPGFQSDKALFYNDTIVYNWLGGDPMRINGHAFESYPDNLNTTRADLTTIQNFARTLLGREASIPELMDALMAATETAADDDISAQQIINYFRGGFGLGLLHANTAETHRFIPDPLGDGIRWDNRLNWSSAQLPGYGDTVELAGNWVHYGGTSMIDGLDLGDGGQLSVNYGRLTVLDSLEVGKSGGTVTTQGAGQFWTKGYGDTDRLLVDVTGGRFANTGLFDGQSSIHVSGQGQAILATAEARMRLTGNSELRIEGSEARVGFDGNRPDTALLLMDDDAVLTLVADREGMARLGEFRSGHWNTDYRSVRSGFSADGILQIDLDAYSGGPGNFTLVAVDALDGIFDTIDIYGLPHFLNARVLMDYTRDELRLELTWGSGKASYGSVGKAGDSQGENSTLWADMILNGGGTYDTDRPTITVRDLSLPELRNDGGDSATVTVSRGTTGTTEGSEIFGTAAGDTLVGDALANTLWGQDGDDVLRGGNGDDTLLGQSGDDALIGQVGNDRLIGGGGRNTYFFVDGDGTDVILDFDPNLDSIKINGTTILPASLPAGMTLTERDGDVLVSYGPEGTGRLWIASMSLDNWSMAQEIQVPADTTKADGSAYSDVIIGNGSGNIIASKGGNDIVHGGGGNDRLFGGGQNDTLHGGADKDKLSGNEGDDTLYGNRGNDVLLGGAGNDLLHGGNDYDWLSGGDGSDILDGGTLRDTLHGGGGTDILIGGAGGDRLSGGTGKTGDGVTDIFLFAEISDSSRAVGKIDQIHDFEAGLDKLHLARIDAIAATPGDDAFQLSDSGAAGTIAFKLSSSGENATLRAHVDDDGIPDLEIYLYGIRALETGDLYL